MNNIQRLKIITSIAFCILFLNACQESQPDSINNETLPNELSKEGLSNNEYSLNASSNQDNGLLTSVIDIESYNDETLNNVTLDEKAEAPDEKAEAPGKKVEALNKEAEATQLIAGLGFSDVQSPDNLQPEKKNYCLINNDVTTPEITILTQECEKISNRLASVTMQGCLDAKLKTTGCRSVLDFPIMVRNFSPLENRHPQGRILVIGGTHADELTSVSTVFKWIDILNKHHSGLFHWHVIPLMNPDGLLKKEATRTNHNGVDLNRNMPSHDWHDTALSYWESKSGNNPRRFPGDMPNSEPETKWLVDEINTFKPDAIISVHAPYGVVDFDSLLLRSAPKSLGKLHLNLLGTYPGSLGNYAGINRNIPVITVELPHAWEMPPESEVTKIWEDIVAWLKINVNDTSDKK